MGIFPDEPGLAGFIGAKVNGSGDDNWSYKLAEAPVKSSPINQHPTFCRPDALPVAQPTVSMHWREKMFSDLYVEIWLTTHFKFY